jgi:anti-sigma regulatory factor (Ser/Thr protein kinase)
MTDRINLEVPASPRALSTVRMVLGGLGARLDFSIDDLEELYLAASELLIAAMRAENPERLAVEIELDGDGLKLSAGPFKSQELRRAVETTSETEACLDLCVLLRSTTDEITIDVHEATAYRVVLVKRRAEALA